VDIISEKSWAVSLHGGHSGEFCDHGTGSLREMVEAAVLRGYRIFGVTEHAPRVEERYLYREEVALGWDVDKLRRDFEKYAQTITQLQTEMEDQITLLKGFEAEVVPSDRYPEVMLGLKQQYDFDYMVGSVHWVDDVSIDYEPEDFAQAVAAAGSVEALAVRYYQVLTEMVRNLKPEVVGHFDVIAKFAGDAPLDTPRIRKAVERALEAVRENECILDVNFSRLRAGVDTIYPAPWILELATRAYGIGVCFGDDSHRPTHVGGGLEEAREYLLRHRVGEIAVLNRRDGVVVRESVSLE